MVRRNGVFFTVLVAFVVSMGSTGYTFYQLYQTNRIKHINNLFTRYSLISQIYNPFLLKQMSLPILETNLEFYEMYTVNNSEDYRKITHEGILLKEEGQLGTQNFLRETPYNDSVSSHAYVRMLQFHDKIYFWIQSDRYSLLLEDHKVKPYNPSTLTYAYATITLILLFSFGMIVYKLSPLRRLRRQIARFGEGDMGVRFYAKGEDEIALIANELEMAQGKIRSLIESRTLFLRNIMHELKTPIAKGRIVTTMMHDGKQRERLGRIFEKLEELIGEFALIEEISSGSQYLTKKGYRLVDIIDGAIDSAMIEYDWVECSVDTSIKVEVDYRLFVTAVKNLIDNGIKYSPQKRMAIFMEDDEIVFANEGAPLTKPLRYYVEPFTKEHPTKDSFGLGLYIVDAILREHGYVLAYERRERRNCFIFVPLKPKKLLKGKFPLG